MDKRVFALGIIMLAVGFGSHTYLSQTEPAGKADMTDDEKTQFNQDLVVNMGLQNISWMVAGLGFFITLISIGLRGKKKDGAGKTVTQKPAQT